jgi:hypothetical protein
VGRSRRVASAAAEARTAADRPVHETQWAGTVIVGGIGLLFAAGMAVLAVRFLLSLTACATSSRPTPGVPPAGRRARRHPRVARLAALLQRVPDGADHPLGAHDPPREAAERLLGAEEQPQGQDEPDDLVPPGARHPVARQRRRLHRAAVRHRPVDADRADELGGVPNALSAALQYVSLDWPTENGWVNYNALQQLAYFSTVFIAAPLAAITGFRMSGMWPKKNLKLSAAYPIEWARKVHFPVMLFFVVFIVIHVVLVLATGALRNLNHMYAAQGSVDPTAYADNWTGFWLFVVSLVVIAAAWVAARPSCSPRSPACSARSAGADARSASRQWPPLSRASPQNATNSASDRRSGCGVRQNLRSSSARWGRRNPRRGRRVSARSGPR